VRNSGKDKKVRQIIPYTEKKLDTQPSNATQPIPGAHPVIKDQEKMRFSIIRSDNRKFETALKQVKIGPPRLHEYQEDQVGMESDEMTEFNLNNL
jgi:hypothetical protein